LFLVSDDQSECDLEQDWDDEDVEASRPFLSALLQSAVPDDIFSDIRFEWFNLYLVEMILWNNLPQQAVLPQFFFVRLDGAKGQRRHHRRTADVC
jgi:hypothetical protein